MAERENPAFYRTGPKRPACPVVLSVPHAGRDYTPALLGAARVPRATLETLEDRLMDRLVWRAAQAGCTVFVAQAPRAEIDLNRDECEVDPATIFPTPRDAVQTVRTRGGLGLVPTRLADVGPLWRGRIRREELDRRITAIHRPYHQALEHALEAARAQFGVAVLLDCHSMPPRAAGAGGAPVILGDRLGTSCASDYVDAAADAAALLGYRTARNHPYAGGYIACRHGHPEDGIHAIQLEIDRALYLGPDLREPGPGFDAAARLIAAVAASIEAKATATPHSIAAE
jgi:N-formylglutamate amidohydrolase